MRRLFEGFKILCNDYDHMLEKGGILFKGGHYVREDIIEGNTVYAENMRKIVGAVWELPAK
jgi:hypothetical protein